MTDEGGFIEGVTPEYLAEQTEAAVKRMREWASMNPSADTQGLMDGEWDALARAALGFPQAEDNE